MLPALDLLVIIDPQLFVEGDHRSAALFASHELMLAGLPPFVLDAGLAPGGNRTWKVSSPPGSIQRDHRFDAIIESGDDRQPGEFEGCAASSGCT